MTVTTEEGQDRKVIPMRPAEESTPPGAAVAAEKFQAEHEGPSTGILGVLARLVIAARTSGTEADGGLMVACDEAEAALQAGAGEVSDGFHTFSELYAHRHALFIALMRSHPDLSWRSGAHHDGSMMGGWFIAGMRLPSGDITYHLPVAIEGSAAAATERDRAPEWDGHTHLDVIERLFGFHPELRGELAVLQLEKEQAEALNKGLSGYVDALSKAHKAMMKLYQFEAALDLDREQRVAGAVRYALLGAMSRAGWPEAEEDGKGDPRQMDLEQELAREAAAAAGQLTSVETGEAAQMDDSTDTPAAAPMDPAPVQPEASAEEPGPTAKPSRRRNVRESQAKGELPIAGLPAEAP